MRRFVATRLGLSVLVILAAYTVSFIVLYVVPGDPVSAMLSGGIENGTVTQEELAAARAEYGFNDPLLVQYASRLGTTLTGDLGASVQTGRSVISTILEALPSTLALTGLALVLSLIVGIGLAFVATYTSVRWLRQVLLSVAPTAASVPTFWVGLMLLQWFSFQWGLFPALGNHGWRSLVLPAVTLAIPIGAMIAQVLAAALEESLAEGYIVTARSKGISKPAIHLRHGLRNASLPALTVVGLIVGNLIAGSVVVETVFSRQGLGKVTIDAVSFQDLPVVQGVVLFGAAVFVLANLAVDLALPALDPRVSVLAAGAGQR